MNFGAFVNGDPFPAVQWYEKTKTATKFSAIDARRNPSAATTTLTITPGQTDNGAQFQAVFTSTIGTKTFKVTSKAATLTLDVAPFHPRYAHHPHADGRSVNPGQRRPPPARRRKQVQRQTSSDGVNFININTTAAKKSPYIFTPTAAMDGTYLRAAFSNAVGQAFTNADLLTVNFAPTITKQPTSQTVAVNTAATFTASAAGDPRHGAMASEEPGRHQIHAGHQQRQRHDDHPDHSPRPDPKRRPIRGGLHQQVRHEDEQRDDERGHSHRRYAAPGRDPTQRRHVCGRRHGDPIPHR